MKKKLFMLLAAMLCLSAISKAQDVIDVTLIEPVPNHEQGPRSPAHAPILCCVISNTIYLTFSNDLGEIDVTLEEESLGVILQTSIDSSELSAVLPFSGMTGEYTITFTLPSGVSYYGLFVL